MEMTTPDEARKLASEIVAATQTLKGLEDVAFALRSLANQMEALEKKLCFPDADGSLRPEGKDGRE